jgi:hypothetical protein
MSDSGANKALTREDASGRMGPAPLPEGEPSLFAASLDGLLDQRAVSGLLVGREILGE